MTPPKKVEVIDEVFSLPKLSPFDFTKSITYGKNDIWEESGEDIANRSYIPYLVNRGLSQSIDTVLFANEINKYHDLPKRTQYEFYLHAVPKRKRFDKWAKADAQDEKIGIIREYYGYTIEVAIQAARILTSDQVKELKQRMSKGGVE
jgi:hypothetical protein